MEQNLIVRCFSLIVCRFFEVFRPFRRRIPDQRPRVQYFQRKMCLKGAGVRVIWPKARVFDREFNNFWNVQRDQRHDLRSG